MYKSLTFLGTLICLFLLLSCDRSTSNERLNLQDEQAFLILQDDISSFDAKFQQEYGSELRCSWEDLWSAIKEFFSDCGSVVVADIAAAADKTSLSLSLTRNTIKEVSIKVTIEEVGTVISASVSTARDVFGRTSTTEQSKSYATWQNCPSYSMEYTGSILGEAHNVIIKELCALYKDKGLNEVSDEQMNKDILSLTLKYFNLSDNAVDKDLWKSFQASSELIRSEVSHLTSEEAVSYLRTYPKGDPKELNIIADYIVKIKSLPTEKLRKAYAKGFMNTIKLSTIPEINKQTIMNATSTGLNSIALWEQK